MKTTMLHKKTKALGAWMARTICIAGMLLAVHTVTNAQFYLVEDFSTAETGFYYDGFPVTNTSTEYGFNWWFNPGQSLVFARGAVQTNDPDKDLIAAGNTYLLDLPGSLMINNQIKPYPAKLDLLNEQNGFPIVPTGYKSVSVTIAGSKIAASDIDWDTWNTVINPYTDPTVDETITYLNPKLDPFDGSKNGYTIQFTSKSNPTVESPEYTDQGIWHTYTFDVNSAGYTPQSIVFQGKTRGTFDYTDNVPWSGSHDVTQGFFSTPIIIGKIIFEYETKPSWASTTSLPQTISFDKLSGAVGETVTATTTAAGHTVSYIVADQSIAKADGNGGLTLLKAGTTEVTAYVAGDAAYDAAVKTVTITVNAAKTAQSITGLNDITTTYGNADFELTATGGASGNAVTYAITEGNGTVAELLPDGKTVKIKGAGTAQITASQAGNDNYEAATVTATLTVNRAAQTISGLADISKTVSDADFPLSATTTSGLPLTYGSSNEAVATIISGSSTVHIVGAGTTIITASQAGDDNYLPAANVPVNLVVTNPAGLWDVRDNTSLSITGNPVQGNEARLTFTEASQGAVLRVTDLTGKTLIQQNLAEGLTTATIPVASLSKGVYLVNYSDNNGKRATVKMIK